MKYWWDYIAIMTWFGICVFFNLVKLWMLKVMVGYINKDHVRTAKRRIKKLDPSKDKKESKDKIKKHLDP